MKLNWFLHCAAIVVAQAPNEDVPVMIVGNLIAEPVETLSFENALPVPKLAPDKLLAEISVFHDAVNGAFRAMRLFLSAAQANPELVSSDAHEFIFSLNWCASSIEAFNMIPERNVDSLCVPLEWLLSNVVTRTIDIVMSEEALYDIAEVVVPQSVEAVNRITRHLGDLQEKGLSDLSVVEVYQLNRSLQELIALVAIYNEAAEVMGVDSSASEALLTEDSSSVESAAPTKISFTGQPHVSQAFTNYANSTAIQPSLQSSPTPVISSTRLWLSKKITGALSNDTVTTITDLQAIAEIPGTGGVDSKNIAVELTTLEAGVIATGTYTEGVATTSGATTITSNSAQVYPASPTPEVPLRSLSPQTSLVKTTKTYLSPTGNFSEVLSQTHSSESYQLSRFEDLPITTDPKPTPLPEKRVLNSSTNAPLNISGSHQWMNTTAMASTMAMIEPAPDNAYRHGPSLCWLLLWGAVGLVFI